MIVLDHGVVAWVSESLHRWTRSPDRWIGQPLDRLIDLTDDYEQAHSPFQTMLHDPEGHSHHVCVSVHALGDQKVALTLRSVEHLPHTDSDVAEALTRYRLFMENTADVVVHTLEGVLQWVSPSVEDLTGWTPGELIGRTTAHLWHPEDVQIAIHQREEAYAGRLSRGTLRFLRKDGEYMWLDVLLKPYREPDGRRGAVGSLRDVTDYVRAREESEAQQARLRLLLDSLLEPHMLLRAARDESGQVTDFTIVTANQAAATQLGAQVEDLVDMSLSGMLAPSDSIRVIPDLASWLDAGTPVVLTDWQSSVQGTDAYYDVSISVLDDQLMVSWRDVTSKHHVTSQLQQSEAAYRLLTENAADLILQLGADDRLIWASPSSHRLLGYLPEHLLGDFPWEIVHDDDRSALQSALRMLRNGDQFVASREVRLRHRHGPYSWWSVNARRTRDDPRTSEIVLALSNIDTQKRDSLELLHEQEQRSAALQSMLDPHVLLQSITDDAGSIVDLRYADANEAACSYMGMTRSELVGSTVMGLLPAHTETGLLDLYRQTLATGEPLVLDDFAYPHEVQGQTRRFDIRAVKIGDSLSFTWRDVTDQHEVAARLAASEERYRLLAENATDVVFRTDRQATITFISGGVHRLFGFTAEQVQGTHIGDYVHPDDRRALQGLCNSAERIPPFRLRVRANDSRHVWVEVNARSMLDDSGEPAGVVGGCRDVSAEVEIQRQLREQARTDNLTGLLNRREVLGRLDAIMSHAPRTGTRVAVAFIDIDGLKTINDTHGHAAGNAVIRAVAQRLRSAVRSDDLVARIGGDELLVVLPGIHSLQEAMDITDTLRRIVGRPVYDSDLALELHSTVSIGVTLITDDDTAEAVIARADKAMYDAKRQGDQVSAVL